MNQIRLLLFTLMSLSLSGCAASLIYDQDRTPRDCRETPERRCLNAVDIPGGVYRVSVNTLSGT